MNDMNILTVNGEQYNVADKTARGKIANDVANVIKETITGTTVSTDMVSPIEHDVECKIESKNLFDISKITDVTNSNGRAIINNKDGSISIKTNIEGAPAASDKLLKDILRGGSVGDEITLAATTSAEKQGKFIYLSKASMAWKFGTSIVLTDNILNSPVLFYGDGSNSFVKLYNIIAARGEKPLEYIPNIPDLSTVTVTQNPGGKTFKPNADGVVTGMKSISPSMKILTDNPGANLEVTYNADTKKYVESIASNSGYSKSIVLDSSCYGTDSSVSTLDTEIDLIDSNVMVCAMVATRSDTTFTGQNCSVKVLRESTHIDASNYNQRLYFLKLTPTGGSKVQLKVRCSKAGRIYVNLIACYNCKDILYHSGSEAISVNSPSVDVKKNPSYNNALWGATCTLAPDVTVEESSKTPWICKDLINKAIPNLPEELIKLDESATRLASFFDPQNGIHRIFSSPLIAAKPSSNEIVADCVELIAGNGNAKEKAYIDKKFDELQSAVLSQGGNV